MSLDALMAAVHARAWYPVAGIGLFLLLDVLKRIKLDWTTWVPVGWRWVIPIALGGVTGFVDAYVSGQAWEGALIRAAYAMIAIGLPAMGTQGGLVESKLTGGGMWGGPGGGPLPPKRESERPTDPAPPIEGGVAIKRVEVKISPALVEREVRRAFARIAIGIALVFGVVGCASGDKAQAAMVQRTEALALNGATLAFEIVKAEERHRVDAIAKPTPDELAVMDRRLEQIKRVEAALNLAQDYVAGKKDGTSREALGDALDVLTLLVDELKQDGVKIPDRAVEGLKLAALFVKVGGS